MLISLLQKQIPFIDVRAPVEFSKGALPTSTNLPILLDEERELVGKAYKKDFPSFYWKMNTKKIDLSFNNSR